MALLQLANQKYDFFPINRSLGLQQEEDDNKDHLQKMMSSYISYLVTTQKKEASVFCYNCLRSKVSLSVTLLSIRTAPRYANVNTDRVASISEYATYQSMYAI